MVPSLHDAEVVELLLDRTNARCRVKIHGFQMTPDLDGKGFYVSTKHVVITFQFNKVEKLELTDFNHQNVLDDVGLTRQSSGNFLFDMKPCYGLFGTIEAADWRSAFSLESQRSAACKLAVLMSAFGAMPR